jgi:hypothetical protein
MADLQRMMAGMQSELPGMAQGGDRSYCGP